MPPWAGAPFPRESWWTSHLVGGPYTTTSSLPQHPQAPRTGVTPVNVNGGHKEREMRAVELGGLFCLCLCACIYVCMHVCGEGCGGGSKPTRMVAGGKIPLKKVIIRPGCVSGVLSRGWSGWLILRDEQVMTVNARCTPEWWLEWGEPGQFQVLCILPQLKFF